MKSRDGFVSNSSSSSFLIGMKGRGNQSKFLEVLKVPKNSPLYNLAKDIADFLAQDSKKTTVEEYIQEWLGYESLEELEEEGWDKNTIKTLKRIKKKGLDLYAGSASNEGEEIEAAICEIGFNVNEPDFVFYKEAGY